MNRFCLLLCLICKLALGQSPPLTGSYFSKYGGGFISVSDSLIEFQTLYGCCISTTLYGYGKYEIRKDSVFISTGTPKIGRGSTYQVLGDLPKQDEIKIKVMSDQEPNPFAFLAVIDKSTEEIIWRGPCNRIDTAFWIDSLPVNNIDNKIVEVFDIGSGQFEIPLSEIIGKSILVNLANYKVLHELVAFKVSSDSGRTTLTGPIFPLTKEEIKEAKKAKRKRHLDMMRWNWPWRWRFKSNHVAQPRTFVRQ